MKEIARVLVIKFDDLADFVASFAAMKHIREAYPHARITLMTSPAFSGLARVCPYLDQVDSLAEIEPMTLAGAIKRQKYDLVVDLDAAPRSAQLKRWAWPFRPAWSLTSRDKTVPLIDRHAAQLKAAGIWPDAPTGAGEAPPPDMIWLTRLNPPGRPVAGASKPRPYVVLAPGGPEARRWPGAYFGAVAQDLRAQGYDIVVVGQPDESALARLIQKSDPKARDLTGRTDYAVIAALGFKAALAIGNETGLLHLVASAGAPTLVLHSAGTDPLLTAPRGHVAVLQSEDLATMMPAQVLRAAASLLPAPAAVG